MLEDNRNDLEGIEMSLRNMDQITPSPSQVMRAFELPVDQVKVLLLGQDPYPTAGVACGLAFAVAEESKFPQSLKNLMKELASDLPGTANSGDLSNWADQGVLMLNTALTTEIGKPAAHAKMWRKFTEAALQNLDRSRAGELVCLSLGSFAQKISSKLSQTEVIQAVHPSPLSANRGFFGSKIYSRVNSALQSKGISPIDWSC